MTGKFFPDSVKGGAPVASGQGKKKTRCKSTGFVGNRWIAPQPGLKMELLGFVTHREHQGKGRPDTGFGFDLDDPAMVFNDTSADR